MKSYQSTLKETERLSSSVELLENTSVPTDFFCNKNQPICSASDKRIVSLRKALKFFNDWEECIEESNLYVKSKNLMTSETRDDLNSSILGFISLCQLVIGGGNIINSGFLNSDLVENFFGQQRGIRNGLNSNTILAQYGPQILQLL